MVQEIDAVPASFRLPTLIVGREKRIWPDVFFGGLSSFPFREGSWENITFVPNPGGIEVKKIVSDTATVLLRQTKLSIIRNLNCNERKPVLIKWPK